MVRLLSCQLGWTSRCAGGRDQDGGSATGGDLSLQSLLQMSRGTRARRGSEAMLAEITGVF
jgi:hypothetical protein